MTTAPAIAAIHVPGSSDNWFHWLIQALPALYEFVKRGVEFDELYVGKLTPARRESLHKACNFLQIDKGKLIEAETSECPTENPPDLTKEHIQFLCSIVKPAGYWLTILHQPRIFLSREGFPRHRAPVQDFAKALGCAVVNLDRVTFTGQAQIIDSAKLIVSQIGSGLSNVVFAQPGTHVIELCLDPNQSKMYSNIAALAGCTWERIQL